MLQLLHLIILVLLESGANFWKEQSPRTTRYIYLVNYDFLIENKPSYGDILPVSIWTMISAIFSLTQPSASSAEVP